MPEVVIRTEALTKVYPGDIRAVDGLDLAGVRFHQLPPLKAADETLREPTNLVIRVGTGKPVEEKPEDPKPEQPKPDTPVEDEKGSSAERCVANDERFATSRE